MTGLIHTTYMEFKKREWILNIHNMNIHGFIVNITQDGYIWYNIIDIAHNINDTYSTCIMKFMSFSILFQYEFILTYDDIEILKTLYTQDFITNMNIEYDFDTLLLSKSKNSCVKILDEFISYHINYILITCNIDGWNYTRLGDGG